MQQSRSDTLIYTIAIDAPGQIYHQAMAKLLVSSIIRTGYSGDILIFTNSEHRIFEFGRKNLEEESLFIEGLTPETLPAAAKKLKFRAASLIDASRYKNVVFVDVDCLFLKDPTDMFAGDDDIVFAEEPHHNITNVWDWAFLTDHEMQTLEQVGINSGFFCIKGHLFRETMAEWERINAGPPLRRRQCTDQSGWVRFLLDTRLSKRAFSHEAIIYPALQRLTFLEVFGGTLLHFAGYATRPKLATMYGVYMAAFQTSSINGALCMLDG